MRRDDRRLRRRPPRPPADHRPGGRAGPRARACRASSLTFDPHPSEVVRPGSPPADAHRPAATRPTCSRRSASTSCACCRSRRTFSRLSADEFVHAVLVERLHVSARRRGGELPLRPQGQPATSPRSPPTAGASASPSRASPLQGSARHDLVLDVRPLLRRRRRRDGRRRRARPRPPGRRRRRARRPARPRRSATRRPTSSRCRGAPCPPTASTPGGWCAATASSCRRRSASAPTRPSPGRERRVEAYVLDAPPGSTSTASTSGSTSPPALRDTLRFDGVEPLVAQMAQDVAPRACAARRSPGRVSQRSARRR